MLPACPPKTWAPRRTFENSFSLYRSSAEPVLHEHQFINNLVPLCYHALYYCKFVRNKYVCLMSYHLMFPPPSPHLFSYLSYFPILFLLFTIHRLSKFLPFYLFLKVEIKNNALILLEDVDVVFNDQGYYHGYKLNFYSRKSLSARVPLVTIHIIYISEPAR